MTHMDSSSSKEVKSTIHYSYGKGLLSFALSFKLKLSLWSFNRFSSYLLALKD